MSLRHLWQQRDIKKNFFNQTTWSTRPKQSNVAAQKCLFTQNDKKAICLLLTLNQQLTSLSVIDSFGGIYLLFVVSCDHIL